MRRGHLPGKNTHANQQESAQEHTEVYGRSKIHEGDGIKQRSTATSARQEAEPPNFSLIQITLTTWLFLFFFHLFFFFINFLILKAEMSSEPVLSFSESQNYQKF